MIAVPTLALSLDQPIPWAVSYADCDTINLPDAAPIATKTVYGCSRLGGTEAELYAALRADKADEPRREPKHASGCPGNDWPHHVYDGMGYYRSEKIPIPLYVAIHTTQERRTIDTDIPKDDRKPFHWPSDWPVVPPDVDIFDDLPGWSTEREITVGDRSMARFGDDGKLTHATDYSAYGFDDSPWWNEGFLIQPFGSIVAIAEIVGSHEDYCESDVNPGGCSPWSFMGGYRTLHHWEVTSVTNLKKPIPVAQVCGACGGGDYAKFGDSLGHDKRCMSLPIDSYLWTMSEETTNQIKEQMEG